MSDHRVYVDGVDVTDQTSWDATSNVITFDPALHAVNGTSINITVTSTSGGEWHWSATPEPSGEIIDRFARDLARRFPA